MGINRGPGHRAPPLSDTIVVGNPIWYEHNGEYYEIATNKKVDVKIMSLEDLAKEIEAERKGPTND